MQAQVRSGLCPQCGYNEHKYQAHPLYLQPRTLLKNQYIIGLPLGQGGFGVTYLGLDQWLQKKVAIKEYLPVALATRNILNSNIVPLKPQEENFRQGIQFFINEARNLAKFDHPHIVRIINFFEENQTGYMVMDYLAGTHLAAMLSQGNNRLSIESALNMVLPILDALAQVHAQHIYHRDISLQNILILPTGEPILIDFGAARHIVGEYTRSLDLVLKHGYSPLEQYSGKGKIGPWTDIYACGALLYLLITGQLPPAATDRFGGERLIAPTELGIAISPSINEAIMHALAIRIEDRFQTVQDFKAALQGQIALSPATTVTASQSRNNYKLHWQFKKIVMVVVTSILLFTLVGLFFYQREPSLLQSLLTQAQVQWENNQITQPVGDNAYETYQQILAIAPNQVEAQAGILKIVKYYEQLARDNQQAKKLTDSLANLKQGLQIMPNYLPLQILEQQLQQALAQQQQVKIRAEQIKQLLNQADKQLTLLQLEAAYQTYQAVLNLEPHNQLAPEGIKRIAEKYVQLAQSEQENTKKLLFINEGLERFPHHEKLLALQQKLTDSQYIQQHIEILVKKAEQQLAALRLTTPAGDNAYETYQEILKRVPEHPAAKAGLIKIADQYEQLAQIDRANLAKSLALINKGLQVFPNHAGLLALNQTIREQMQRKVVNSEQPAVAMELNPSTPLPPSVSKSPLPVLDPVNKLSPTPLPQPVSKPQLPSIRVEKPQDELPPSQLLSSAKPGATPATHNVVEELLVIAKQHVEANQFDAAYQTYQNILTITPQNESAKIGLQQLAHHYEQLAQLKSNQGDLEASLLLINKGLLAYPTHQGLLTLREEINRRLKEKTNSNTQQPSHLIFTPSF